MQGTIVIAERSRTVRKMIEIALARQPYTLNFTGDSEAALKAVRSSSPSMVIIDPNLTGDGYATARRIREDHPSTKIVLLIGKNQSVDEVRASVADAQVTKPFLTQDLVKLVAELHGKREPDEGLYAAGLQNIPLARPQEGAAQARPAVKKTPGAAIKRPAPPPKAPASKPAAKAGARKIPPPPKKPKAPPPPRKPARSPASLRPSAPKMDAVAQAAASAISGSPQLAQALSGASKETIEQIAWEVIPRLAEAILKEEIARVVRERIAAG